MWEGMPTSESRSANQPYPKVASKATPVGSASSSPKTRRNSSGRLAIRQLASSSPPSVSTDVRGLAVKVHSDVDHDSASFLSFVSSGRYDVTL